MTHQEQMDLALDQLVELSNEIEFLEDKIRSLPLFSSERMDLQEELNYAIVRKMELNEEIEEML